MATHAAVAAIGIKKPLSIIQVPTVKPEGDEVRVRVEWTVAAPADLHQSDGNLIGEHPLVLGLNVAGTVVEVGPEVKRLKVGDKVFGFTWRTQKEKAYQVFCTTNEWLFALLPQGFSMEEAVTLPDTFVTVFHTGVTDLGIELPWPKPEGYVPKDAQAAFLVWGGSSSSGQFAIQILRYYGYTNILTTASKKHHGKLRSLGAKHTFDYNDPDVVSSILNTASLQTIPLILDCITSKEGSIKPISKIAKSGARVAALLPVVVRDSSETVDPVYSMDVGEAADWAEGVETRGVRTFTYLNDEFFKYHLQPDIMHTMLKERIVQPNDRRIIEGETLLERAQKSLDALRRKEASGERLAWRVAEA